MTTTTDRPSFSAVIRVATADAHRRAERSGFLAALVGGELPRHRYGSLVAQHWFVYDALERAVADSDDPVVAELGVPALTRVPSLEADLAHIEGADWRDRIQALPATLAYRERLDAVAGSWPGGIVAHHYVRYLGDLSGGLFIGRRVADVYGLHDGRGVAFYRFGDIEDPAGFKNRYRATLDAATWCEDERARVLDEILVGYDLNTAVLDELAAG